MKTIYILVNYKGQFESKQNSIAKRSGFDFLLLRRYFDINGFTVEFIDFDDINFRSDNFKDKYVIYMSSEDPGVLYKDYIEDVILALDLQGAILLPAYKYLRANSNKVFMEILRDMSSNSNIKSLEARHFGVYENLLKKQSELDDKMVLKPAKGARSKGVELSKNKKDLLNKAKKISRSIFRFDEIWDFKNTFKYKGYTPDSKYRKKFIVQQFIPNLKNDWKVLVYGNKVFPLFRKVRDNDFRASGGGNNIFTNDLPKGLLDFALDVRQGLNVPNISIDVAYDGVNFYLIEFQVLYFGTYTIEYSQSHFEYNNKWNKIDGSVILEEVYANSICKYISELNNA